MRDPLSQTESTTALTPIRIIGIGSPFGADQMGWIITQHLQKSGLLAEFPAGLISVSQCDRPGAMLLQEMVGAQLVLLIDAMTGERPPGSLQCFQGRELIDSAPLLSSHAFDVSSALALGDALGQLPDRLYMLGISIGPADDFPAQPISGLANDLTSPELITKINREIIRIITGFQNSW